ncbi:WYL domain-containing protein [Bacillus sp. MUM 13]|uniref:WYL domain-containing protein n=1 Tax=Bacillus sp. MUM 13 TaxID=1678001 RepID=UPI0008F5BC20|nr:WYL domain-containing protein [Bacillus sp. MUM 13]OIK11105.1 hypothetical protein BIV59_13125 [Bacillus sp. MUM 13]
MNSTLLRSLKEDSLLEIIYLSEKGQVSQRRIQVLDLTEEYVRAYCFLRKTNRTFKISNILSCRISSQRYKYSG